MDKVAQRPDARRLFIQRTIGIFFAATAVTASLAYAEPHRWSAGRGALGAPKSHQPCTRHYAGHCRPNTPCYRSDLRGWRYGDERDFSCFIYEQN